MGNMLAACPAPVGCYRVDGAPGGVAGRAAGSGRVPVNAPCSAVAGNSTANFELSLKVADTGAPR